MHWKRSFPSKYLQTSDLDDGPVITTIVSVDTENIGVGEDAELKPVAKLRTAKSLVLNVTKCNSIEEIAGTPDMDAWPGTHIQLQKGSTKYKGKKVACIDVVAPAQPSSKPVKPEDSGGGGDDQLAPSNRMTVGQIPF